jgi:hypothetical protein
LGAHRRVELVIETVAELTVEKQASSTEDERHYADEHDREPGSDRHPNGWRRPGRAKHCHATGIGVDPRLYERLAACAVWRVCCGYMRLR